MRFGAGLSTELDTDKAAAAAVQAALAATAGAPIDLAAVFASHHHVGEFDRILSAVHAAAGPAHLIGNAAAGVIAAGREVESEPAVAVWLAGLPGAAIGSFAVEFQPTPEGPVFTGVPDDLPAAPVGGCAAFLLIGDPFTFPADAFLDRLGEDFPGVPVIGGMAGGAHRPGDTRLFLGKDERNIGAVCAHVCGPFALRAVVSQGCRPIGRPLVVTAAEGNVIKKLGGRAAWEQLKEILDGLPPADKALLRNGLHVGRVINEYQESFKRGDFLIRNFMGYDPDSGAIAAGDAFRVGQTVQFHLRDAAAADEDLNELLDGRAGVAGALLFSCNGRGTNLFPGPDHDVSVLRRKLGDPAVAGFFCAGELGPVGGRNFIHGFTASAALFGPA
jgi:small ligand-binding sensory domain FIST